MIASSLLGRPQKGKEKVKMSAGLPLPSRALHARFFPFPSPSVACHTG